jgi:hypothetical protein
MIPLRCHKTSKVKHHATLRHITEELTPQATFEISGYRRQVDENCSLLSCYAACIGNSSLTFRDNLSGLITKGQESKKTGPIGYPETSVMIYHYTPRNRSEQRSCQVTMFAVLTYVMCTSLFIFLLLL